MSNLLASKGLDRWLGVRWFRCETGFCGKRSRRGRADDEPNTAVKRVQLDKVLSITFVVKSEEQPSAIRAAIAAQAIARYKIEAVVESYMAAVEEIINVPALLTAFELVVKAGQLDAVMDKVVAQSKVEFNYSADDEEDESTPEL